MATNPPNESGSSYDPSEPTRPRILTVPWDDLLATNPPDFWLPIHAAILPVLASLVAQGPDGPHLLQTDSLQRLLTASSFNLQAKQMQAVAALSTQFLPDNPSLTPPGTVLLLQNTSGQQELVTVATQFESGLVTVFPALQYAYAIGNPITVIPDVEMRMGWRFVASMTQSPLNTQTMECVLPAGTKCIMVTSRVGRQNVPITACSITGDQTGTVYYNGTTLPGGLQPIVVDAMDDVSVTVQCTSGAGSMAGTAVYCYASFANDVQRITTPSGQSLSVQQGVTPFDVSPAPRHAVKSIAINTAFPINTNTQIIAGVAGQTIRLLSITGAVDTAAAGVLLTFQDGSGGTQIGGHHCGTTTPAHQDYAAALGGRALSVGNGLFGNPGGTSVVFRGTIAYSQD